MRMQIKEFAVFTGVSVRTLHYYDEIGLLAPAYIDKNSGYRFYDESSILRMQEILFYRELDFSLKDIREILSSPNYDKAAALTQVGNLVHGLFGVFHFLCPPIPISIYLDCFPLDSHYTDNLSINQVV